jgi:hypothetical protein
MSENQSNHAQAPVVIVGTGLAGYTVARELRKLDSAVPLVLISQDDGSFYSKPMLSNALAMKKEAHALASFDAAAMAKQLNARIHTHRRVERILPDEHTIVVEGATTVALRQAGSCYRCRPATLADRWQWRGRDTLDQRSRGLRALQAGACRMRIGGDSWGRVDRLRVCQRPVFGRPRRCANRPGQYAAGASAT